MCLHFWYMYKSDVLVGIGRCVCLYANMLFIECVWMSLVRMMFSPEFNIKMIFKNPDSSSHA